MIITQDMWVEFKSLQGAFNQTEEPIIGIDADMGRIVYECYPGTSYPVWRTFFVDPIIARWGKKKLEERLRRNS